jgi:hypothetical protein
MTAIHSLQRCIRRLKPPNARKIEPSLSSSARVALHHGLRIDPLTQTHKDFERAQHEMPSSGHADKCLWFIGAFEQLLRQIYRGDAILVSVNDQNRDMNVTNRESERNWSNISQRTGSIL